MLSALIPWKRSVALSVAVAVLAAAGGLVSPQRHTALAFTPTGAAQAGYSLTASPDRVAPDDTITLTWTAPSGSASLDYVRFFEVGAPDTARSPGRPVGPVPQCDPDSDRQTRQAKRCADQSFVGRGHGSALMAGQGRGSAPVAMGRPLASPARKDGQDLDKWIYQAE